MEVTKIADITANQQQQSINILATVASRTAVKSWKTDRYSGTRISGILCDDSGSIDFVCFTDAVAKFDKVLNENETFSFKHVKVGKPKKQYAKTKHEAEIYIEFASTMSKEDIPPYKYEEAYEFTQIKDLAQERKLDRVTVIGKVIDMPKPETFFDSDIMKVVIQDKTGKVQYSLIGNANKNLNFGLGNVLILSNIQHKAFGQLHCLDGRTGVRVVIPGDQHMNYLNHLPNANSPCVNMSPGKETPTPVSVTELQSNSGRSTITTNIVATNMKDMIYPKCPLVKCNARVTLLENKLFRCNKCDKNYYVSADGLKLTLSVGNEDSSKSLLLFNEKAEQFLSIQTEDLAKTSIPDLEKLETELMQYTYTFVVKPSITEGDFFVESFTCEKGHAHTTNNASVAHQSHSLPAPASTSKISQSVNITNSLAAFNRTPSNDKISSLCSMPSSSSMKLQEHLSQGINVTYSANLHTTSLTTSEQRFQFNPFARSTTSTCTPSYMWPPTFQQPQINDQTSASQIHSAYPLDFSANKQNEDNQPINLTCDSARKRLKFGIDGLLQ